METETNAPEDREVEVLEFSLTTDEIDELVAKLELLKETKETINFDIDDENEFQISFEESI